MQSKLWRRLWHLVGGSLFPVAALYLSMNLLLIILGAVTAIFVIWEIARRIFPGVGRWTLSHLRSVLKTEERSHLTGTTYLLLASLAAFLLFQKYVAITSLLFLSVGDLMAAVVGGRFGRRKIFRKSLEGSLACLVSCFLIGLVMNEVDAAMVLPVTLAGAVAATVAELLPVPINDNITIPIFSGGVMTLTMLLL